MPKILIESPFANEPVDNEALFKFSQDENKQYEQLFQY